MDGKPIDQDASGAPPVVGLLAPVPQPDRKTGAAPRPLTAKQQAIWDLRRPIPDGGQGKQERETAAILGISRSVVNKTMRVIYRKLGLIVDKGAVPVELADPGKAAAMMDALTDPKFDNLAAAMRAAGFPENAGSAFIRRLRVKYAGPTTVARDLQTRELSEMLGKKIHHALSYIDDKVLSEASARDLMMGTAQLIEKRQLLRGEPTQIISDHERKKLHELLPGLLAEAKRRGVTVEGQAERVK